MSNQNKHRIEPTFQIDHNVAEKLSKETAPTANLASISVRTHQSPGHTFTPVLKRPVDKAQQLASLEEQNMLKSEQANNINSTSAKNTGFTFAPVVEETSDTALNREQPTPPPVTDPNNAVEASNTAAKYPETSKTIEAERVITAATPIVPKKEALKEKVPEKFHRLILVVLLALALLFVYFFLKPNTPDTVEALQEQGTSLPIEFRPVDEAEAKRAEEEARALQEAQAQQETQQQAQMEQQTEAQSTPTSTVTTSEVAMQPSETSTETVAPVVVAPMVQQKPVVIEPVRKPESRGSVIHQAENKKSEPKKVEKIKPVANSQPQVRTLTQTAKLAQPATKAVTPQTNSANTASSIVASKTLTVPKGVSLMQVFRDNNLNISDVNAMSKANNAVSNLKVGEKVIVRLDKNNRVAEMSIGAGKYIRQANGSYIFK